MASHFSWPVGCRVVLVGNTKKGDGWNCFEGPLTMSHFARNGRSAKIFFWCKVILFWCTRIGQMPFLTPRMDDSSVWIAVEVEPQLPHSFWLYPQTIALVIPTPLKAFTLNVCIQLQTQMIKSARSVPKMICYCLKNISIAVFPLYDPSVFFFWQFKLWLTAGLKPTFH